VQTRAKEKELAGAVAGLTWPRVRAWSVHLFTALGAVLALAGVIYIGEGQARLAAYVLGAACVIDAVDGGLARAFKVKQWAPEFDGRKLDDIVDYLTYVFAPMYFVYKFDMVPAGWLPVLFLVLLASAYRFCEQSAKTSDGYFTGFPSYWNFVVMYCYLLRLPPLANALILLFWAIMVFVPIKYIYPSHTPVLKALNIGLTAVEGVITVAVILTFDNPIPWLVWLSVAYWVYYLGISFYLNFRTRDGAAKT
jgi:phosphatidylcholine synthase